MRFDDETLKIIKSFVNINPSIYFREGKYISTIASSKNIIARASIEEEIEKPFAIYDLPKFLGILSMFDDYDITLNDSQLEIKSGSQIVKYTYADPDLIIKAPKKALKMTSQDVMFNLSQQHLSCQARFLI